jgi:hypothetical protein
MGVLLSSYSFVGFSSIPDLTKVAARTWLTTNDFFSSISHLVASLLSFSPSYTDLYPLPTLMARP